ncbi:MAG TPA: hypothetical protein HA282_05195 [Nanoarchaeota archaeon]|nr:hypothetical protein [Candidatus Pacearchaeota archaeon]HIH17875.1 hypothetical protein [Nanoarchaeota archaeon]HIH33763.1 hypothetical protein [Nanoarchaeota archaeon]HIH51272.1 hypothetical protein [Nanoarchaeota archaeon]HIH66578.1 hypothetical protein [Nanoarchaeota archaeon]
MESGYFGLDVPRQDPHASLPVDAENVELERETFLSLLDLVNDLPLFIEICEKSQRLTPYQQIMLEELENDYQHNGELR